MILTVIEVLRAIQTVMQSDLTDGDKRAVVLELVSGLPASQLCHGAYKTREIVENYGKRALVSNNEVPGDAGKAHEGTETIPSPRGQSRQVAHANHRPVKKGTSRPQVHSS